ncbi:hypothetical protein, partial [Methylobacter psychrophilus]|uniref:hypothetical protein n=1 Tax=Methylobacter psychrophilus TaxID=96941 RepID=UPI0021D508CC
WIGIQPAPALGSHLNQHSISTGHWFPSESTFNQHRPLVPVWIGIQPAQAIGSRLDRYSTSTSHWFPSGSTFRQSTGLWLLTESRCPLPLIDYIPEY